MNILAALDDPALFAPHFRGESWTAWRAFLAALFGLPMDDATLALYRLHTGRTDPPVEPFAEACLVVGRRGGKSRVLALIAVYLATFRDYKQYLAPGEIATVAIIAADRKQARAIFRFATGLLNATPLLKNMIDDEGTENIFLNNGVIIEIMTASFRGTRGYSYCVVLCDEVAFWRDETSANPDKEILRSIRPGMSTIKNSMLLIASSPYRKSGELYAIYRKHFGKDGSRALVWQASTLSMNPLIDPLIIEEAREDDPEAAVAEFDAQFRDDIVDFVPRAVIDACTVSGRIELPPEGGLRYRAFCDPSGGSADSMTLAISHTHKDRIILDAVREVRPPFSPESVVLDFSTLLKSYGLREVYGDRYAGEWVREPFAKCGIGYKQADQPKSDIYRDSLPLLNSKQVELLDLPRLASQLAGLERRTTRSGKDSIDHGPGGHDDIANAALGALLLAKTRKAPSVIVQQLPY
jgi:hypothetical protein